MQRVCWFSIVIEEFEVDVNTANELNGVILPNIIDENSISLASISTDGRLQANEHHVLARFNVSGEGMLKFTNVELGTSDIPTMNYYLSSDTTNSNGTYQIRFNSGDKVQMQVNADYLTPSTNPITPSDALEVLKTVVRINQAPTPEQLIAGDVDKDGKLTPSDALAILKKVVRMDGGVEPEWIFVNGEADHSEMMFTRVNYDPVVEISSISLGSSLNFEGILLGDFDGTL